MKIIWLLLFLFTQNNLNHLSAEDISGIWETSLYKGDGYLFLLLNDDGTGETRYMPDVRYMLRNRVEYTADHIEASMFWDYSTYSYSLFENTLFLKETNSEYGHWDFRKIENIEEIANEPLLGEWVTYGLKISSNNYVDLEITFNEHNGSIGGETFQYFNNELAGFGLDHDGYFIYNIDGEEKAGFYKLERGYLLVIFNLSNYENDNSKWWYVFHRKPEKGINFETYFNPVFSREE